VKEHSQSGLVQKNAGEKKGPQSLHIDPYFNNFILYRNSNNNLNNTFFNVNVVFLVCIMMCWTSIFIGQQLAGNYI
jgi:hypothetical protein